jgi:hypothetical protein
MDSNKLLIGLTGRNAREVIKKIHNAEKFGITRAALFLEFLSKKQREKVYKILKKTKIKDLPLVHIRHDINKDEIKFLKEKFKTKCFNIHTFGLNNLEKWAPFQKDLYLELHYHNNPIDEKNFQKIGGFCIDLSHFKASQDRKTSEYEFIMKKKNEKKLFVGNHLNGYSKWRKIDKHRVLSKKQFNYLLTLPNFLFGDYIALEMFNSVKKQIKYKEYLLKLLKDKL